MDPFRARLRAVRDLAQGVEDELERDNRFIQALAAENAAIAADARVFLSAVAKRRAAHND